MTRIDGLRLACIPKPLSKQKSGRGKLRCLRETRKYFRDMRAIHEQVREVLQTAQHDSILMISQQQQSGASFLHPSFFKADIPSSLMNPNTSCHLQASEIRPWMCGLSWMAAATELWTVQEERLDPGSFRTVNMLQHQARPKPLAH